MPEWASPNFDDRPAATPVDTLVMHYTGMKTTGEALDRLCDPQAKVSAHYFIDVDGTITALVDEEKRAWHAGEAFWRGHTDINARSIGIELVNPGHEYGYVPFPDDQMTALIELTLGILKRHPIEPRNVVGHADVAPQRKLDPGEQFDWFHLSMMGIGLWPQAIEAPEDAEADEAVLKAMLVDYGYETEDLAATLTAFQRHFRPGQIDGRGDPETVGRLKSLLTQIAG